MRFEPADRRDTTMQYGAEEGAKSGFAGDTMTMAGEVLRNT
jgi:hypothetical protein